eukprot:c46327_g1_i1.p1 GENE.c46327_g1_i1~~c46327_g1_i1.p1  ORF type:complete len:317 (+),score=23.87 c46327_g1_i1:32-982(+)
MREVIVGFYGNQGIGKGALLGAFSRKDLTSYSFCNSVVHLTSPHTGVAERILAKYLDSLRPSFGRVAITVTMASGGPAEHAVVLCFAVDDVPSFESVAVWWAPRVRARSPCPPLLLVGLRSDLRASSARDPSTFVSPQDARELANRLGAIGYFEVSAMNYVNAFTKTSRPIFLERNNLQTPVPAPFVPAGGVEILFEAAVQAGYQHMSTNGILNLSRTWSQRVVAGIFHLTGKSATAKPFSHDLERFTTVLMCKHPRLGLQCCPYVKEIPDEIWLKIFTLVAHSPRLTVFHGYPVLQSANQPMNNEATSPSVNIEA